MYGKPLRPSPSDAAAVDQGWHAHVFNAISRTTMARCASKAAGVAGGAPGRRPLLNNDKTEK